MATQTPWGKSQSSKKYAHGVICYSCAWHGGFHLSPTRNAKVHEAWRRESGWYEEDCEWAIVALTFPELFTADGLSYAVRIAKDYWPDEYTKVTDLLVDLSESQVLRERADRIKYAEEWIGVGAYGDWHCAVPAGMVGVYARQGKTERCGAGPERYFLIPADEYADDSRRCSIGFVLGDISRYAEVGAFYPSGQAAALTSAGT